MTIDHLSEFLVRFQTLPLQTCAPVLEESPRRGLTLIIPELIKGLLKHVSGVQALVGSQQRLEGMPAFQGKVLAIGQHRVLLAFDITAIAATKPRVLALSYFIERLAQMTHDAELVKQNCRLWRCGEGSVTKWLPHIHHRQANARAVLLAQPVLELLHARLRAILATEPDRSAADGPRPATQIARHDTIGVTLLDRYLVDTDGLGSWRPRFGKLRTHVLHVQR